MAPPSVLILGAGELGIEVLRSIAQHPRRENASVAVLKRSAIWSTTPTLEELEVQLVLSDLATENEDAQVEKFRPFHTVMNCSGMQLAPEVQIKIADAALKAKVKRYFPWQFGGDYDRVGRGSAQPLLDMQLDVRDLLRAQTETAWVIVSVGISTSFVFEPGFCIVSADRSTVTALRSWDTPIMVTSPVDIGKVTAELVIFYPEIQGVVHIAGDTFYAKELARIIESATGKAVQTKLRVVDELKVELPADPDDHFKRYRVIFAEGRGFAWDKAGTFNEKQGIEMETVEEWVKKHLHAS